MIARSIVGTGGGARCRRCAYRNGFHPLLRPAAAACFSGPRRLPVEEVPRRAGVGQRHACADRTRRGLQLEVGHPEAPGQGPLVEGERLRALVRHDDEPAPQHTGAQQQGRPRDREPVAAPREGGEPAGAAGRGGEPLVVVAAHQAGGEDLDGARRPGLGEHQRQGLQHLVPGPDGQQRGTRLPLGGGREAVPGHVHGDAVPALGAPQRRLHDAERLDPAGRDGLRPRVEQAVAHPDAVRRRGGTEVVARVQGGPVGAGHADEDGDEGRRDDRGVQGDAEGDDHGGCQYQGHGGPGQGDRADHPTRRDRHHLALGRLDDRPGVLRVLGDARSPREDRGAQPPGVVELQKGEPDGGFPGVGHLELQFGQAEDPGEERLDDVDRLHAVQPRLPLLPEDDPGVHAHVLGRHLVAREVPGDEEDGGDHQDDGEQDPGGEQDADALGQGSTAPRPAREHALEPVPADEVEDGHQDDPAAHQRRDEVDAVPGVTALTARVRFLGPCGRRQRVGGVVHGGHSPASLASPRADSCSRRRAPSSAGSPGIRALVAGDAVCSFSVQIP